MYVGMPYALAAIAMSSAWGPANGSAASPHVRTAYDTPTAFLSHYTTVLQFLETMAFNQTLQSIDRSAKIGLLFRPDEQPHARQSKLGIFQHKDFTGAARTREFTQVGQKPGSWIGQCRIDVRVIAIEWEFGVSPNSRVGCPNKVAHGERPVSMCIESLVSDECIASSLVGISACVSWQ